MENYLLVLSPAIDLTPDEFVEMWNDTPEAYEKAWASYTSESTTNYNFYADAILLTMVIIEGLATNAIYDLIKTIIAKAISMKKSSIKETVDETSLKTLIKISQTELSNGILIREVTFEQEEKKITHYDTHTHH